jgi:fumarate hydratase subunit alpha
VIGGISLLNKKIIESSVIDCVVKAGTNFRTDQAKAYQRAIRNEINQNAKWALKMIVENFKTAKKRLLPLCDDTGIPHAIVEIGRKTKLPAGWMMAIEEGIIKGLREMPARPMAVKGNVKERIEQSKGMYKDPGKLTLAPVITKNVQGEKLKITVLLLGGGPEIRAKTYRIYHRRSMNLVLEEAANWITSEIKGLGCTPCVPAIGIGRSHMEASALMLDAMKEGNLGRQNEWEQKVTDLINATGTGPLGLGGTNTALGTFIKVGPLRAGGVRIVSVRPGCCFEPRKASVRLV